MTTRSCLLHENRNPNLTQQTIEDYLRRYLSIDHVIWLDAEIAGDDTDGHIDQLARFVDVNVVVVATETNRSDINFMPLSLLCQQLRSEVLPNVGQLHVVELPMPEPVYHDSRRLPASYTNFYIANNIVLVPQFGDKHDARACDVLRELFPHREVAGLACRELALALERQDSPPIVLQPFGRTASNHQA